VNRVSDSIIFILVILIVLGLLLFIDFSIISPIILPEDLCYYHTHEVPIWVDVLYMNGSSNGHPEWTFTHIFLVLILSIILSTKAMNYLRREQYL
jgi:hypothetical protein